jgi:hypothetical protein
MELIMFKVGDIITIKDLDNPRKIKVNEEIIYQTGKQILTLQPMTDKNAEGGIMSYSYLQKSKHRILSDTVIRFDYWIVTKLEKSQYKRPKAKNKKMDFLRKHNDRINSTDNRVYICKGILRYQSFDEGRISPMIYGEYVSQLDSAISRSPSLMNLYLHALDNDYFNWVGSVKSTGVAPSRLLDDHFVINSRNWNDNPYWIFEYKIDQHDWWFSVFEDYELLGSIDFYYPINHKIGDNIDIIIVYNYNKWFSSNKRILRVNWVDGASGLTIFCLLPHIYMFLIELAAIRLGLSSQKANAIRNYCYNRMLDSTKIIRDKNAIINF